MSSECVSTPSCFTDLRVCVCLNKWTSSPFPLRVFIDQRCSLRGSVLYSPECCLSDRVINDAVLAGGENAKHPQPILTVCSNVCGSLRSKSSPPSVLSAACVVEAPDSKHLSFSSCPLSPLRFVCSSGLLLQESNKFSEALHYYKLAIGSRPTLACKYSSSFAFFLLLTISSSCGCGCAVSRQQRTQAVVM